MAGDASSSGFLRRLRLDPWQIVWLALAAALVVLVVNPLLRLLLISFEHPETGAFTLQNYAQAFGRTRHLNALLNSVILGTAVATLATLIAVPMAWAVSRTDMPGKGLVRVLVLCTFITPPFLGATSWLLLAGPNSGWLNRAFMALTGASSGFLDIYTFSGLVFVLAIYSFPYTFVFVSAALDLVSSEMEDAAGVLGAGRLKTTLRITLPLVTPAILGAWIVTFLEAIAIIGSSVIVALPARIQIVTLQLWQFFGYPLRVEVAAAYAMPLLLITVMLFWIQSRIMHRKGYVALTGKGGERRLIALGKGRWLLLGYCLFILSLSVLLPYLVLLQASFAKAWARGFALSNLTLENFHYLLVENAVARQSLVNTFTYATATATIATVLALCVAYVVARGLVPFGIALSSLCFAPFVVPGMVLAIGFYAAYAVPPLSLSGTALILILAFVTRFLPIAYANASASVKGINPEMEDAVRVLGGGRGTVIRRVVAPLLGRSLIGAWLLVFIPTTREVSAALFLYGPQTKTMSVLFFDLTEGGNFERLAALGIIMLVATTVFVLLGLAVVGRDFMVRRSE